MKRQTLTTLAGFALLLAAGASLGAQTRVTVREDSKLWIEGTSNLHSWSCKATKLEAAIGVDAAWSPKTTEETSFPTMLRSVEVQVPVAAIKCGKDKMDEIMRDALKAKDASEISYILGKFDVVDGAVKNEYTLQTTGTLRIAGKENTVAMNVKAERLPDGTIRALGEVPVLMTDYNVKPPKAMLGALRTGNKVIVKFEMLVSKEAMIAAAASAAP
jgi:hypothetical protein